MRHKVAFGTVTGRDHVRGLRNNQDALAVQQSAQGTVLVVCDGCSSGAHSEVGSQLGARLVCSEVSASLAVFHDFRTEGVVERVRQNMLEHIRRVASAMGGSFSKTINDYFLFTVLVAIIGTEVTDIMSIGDGVYAINGEVVTIGPFEGNAPPYPAYSLTGSSLADQRPGFLKFTLQETCATKDVTSLLIGTDGVRDIINIADRAIPGRTELVGPLSQFWEGERYFGDNPYLLARRLNQINPSQPVVRVQEDGGIVRFEGLLPDDTTLVVARPMNGA